MSRSEDSQGNARLAGAAAALVAVGGAAAFSQPDVSGSDLWWHLAAGREIWAHGEPLRADPFSFTAHGLRWLNPYFLWDAGAWWLHAIDPQLLAWAQLACVVATFGLIYALARRTSGSALAAGAATWAAAAASHWFLDIRPQVASLLLTAALLATRDRPRALWLWPPLIALWANLHGGFAFGIGVVGLYAVVRTLEASWRARRPVVLRGIWLATAGCLLAWMLNPWGPGLMWLHLHALDAANVSRGLIEWAAPGLSLDPRDFAGRFFWLTVAAAPGFVLALRGERSRDLAALCAVTFGMALSARRFIPLFALTAAPLVALAIAAALARPLRRWPALASRSAAHAVTAAGLLAAVWLWQDVRLVPQLFERWTENDRYPHAAVRYLVALGSPERVLNYYGWGGYLMLHAPQSRVFIDGRAEAVYPSGVYVDDKTLRAAAPGFADTLARHAFDAAVLRSEGPLAPALARLPQPAKPWRVVYQDEVASVLLPPDSKLLRGALPRAADVLGEQADGTLRHALAALRDGDRAEAIRRVEAAVSHDPLLVRGYTSLALLHALAGDRDGVERAIADGLRSNPRRWLELRTAEGAAFEQLGDPSRALAAYRRAIPRGPFRSDAEARARVARLERQLRGDGEAPAP